MVSRSIEDGDFFRQSFPGLCYRTKLDVGPVIEVSRMEDKVGLDFDNFRNEIFNEPAQQITDLKRILTDLGINYFSE